MCEYVHKDAHREYIHRIGVLNSQNLETTQIAIKSKADTYICDILLTCNVRPPQKQTRATHTIHLHLKHHIQ